MILRTLATVMLLAWAIPAQAVSPDGPVGTLWVDLSGSMTTGGRWKTPIPGVDEPDVLEEDDHRVSMYGGELGFVASPRLTLRLGLKVDRRTDSDLGVFYEDRSNTPIPFDLRREAMLATLGVRIYLSLPDGGR